MKVTPRTPPRAFDVGQAQVIQLKDCGRIELAPDEQVTFLTEAGGEYDVVRKSWGFYATPSLNGRLKRFGLRAALVKSPPGKFYVVLVEQGKEFAFEQYAVLERYRLVGWLDDEASLNALERCLGGSS